VSEGESWIIFWDRTSFVLISGLGVLPRSELDFWTEESAIVNALGDSRASAGAGDGDEHCLLRIAERAGRVLGLLRLNFAQMVLHEDGLALRN
jgi:hypothetical protein